MRVAEWLTVAFFAYLVTLVLAFGAPRRRIVRLVLLAAACSFSIAGFASFGTSHFARTLRDWIPGVYLLLGYWAAGLTYRVPNGALERWLQHVDGRVFALACPVILRGPRLLLETAELAYLLYYPLVPAGLVALYVTGHRVQADAYWVAVLLAAFASCAVLPLAGTRPPRAIGCEMWIDRRAPIIRRLNCAVLRLGSIQVNTFPSAHAATSTAVAVFLLPLGWVAVPFFVVAAGIGIGAIVGRYHYTMDVVTGMVLGAMVGYVAKA